MVHEPLRVDRRKRVDDLLVAGRAERRDREDLGLPALKERGAVRPRQEPDLDRQRADLGEPSAVRSEALLEHGSTELLLEHVVEGEVDVGLSDRVRVRRLAILRERHERGDRLALELVEPLLTHGFVGIAHARADLVGEERGDPLLPRRIDLLAGPGHLGLAGCGDEGLLRIDERGDAGLSELQRLHQ